MLDMSSAYIQTGDKEIAFAAWLVLMTLSTYCAFRLTTSRLTISKHYNNTYMLYNN